MNEYDVIYKKTITKAEGCCRASLDPSDFLHCNSFKELEDAIHDHFIDDLYTDGDIDVYESTTDIEISPEFLREWRKLKMD